MTVRAEQELTLTRVDDGAAGAKGDKGDRGNPGQQGPA